MRDVKVEASMERREGRMRETIDLAPLTDDHWGALACWPDRWLEPEENAPVVTFDRSPSRRGPSGRGAPFSATARRRGWARSTSSRRALP